MAKRKKPRIPPPRRPVQAPAPRTGSLARPRFGNLNRRGLFAGVASGGAIVIAVVIVILVTGGKSSSSSSAAVAAGSGCTLTTYPALPRNHVASLNAKVQYNSFPPTSGPHFFQPAIWGAYTSPLNLVQEVHNLEHGGVVIQYGGKVPRSAVDQLNAFYQDDPNALLMAPLPALGNKIAATAWTHLLMCTRFNEKALTSFRDAYRYKGPEAIPKQFLNPGQ